MTDGTKNKREAKRKAAREAKARAASVPKTVKVRGPRSKHGCKRTLPLSAFGKRAQCRDGLGIICKECYRRKSADDRNRSRDLINARNRDRYANNIEAERARGKAYRATHPEEGRAYGDAYREANREELRRRQREWYAASFVVASHGCLRFPVLLLHSTSRAVG